MRPFRLGIWYIAEREGGREGGGGVMGVEGMESRETGSPHKVSLVSN